MQNGTRLAAVDLGSNSFRLEIGRYEFGHIQRVEYLKETVRQGNGLDEDRNLTRDLDASATAAVLAAHRFAMTIEAGCGTGKNTPFLASPKRPD